jgi:hypothetical protein
MKETKTGTRKRKQSMHSSEIPRKINNHFGAVQGLYRTFKNPDNETCWMNSCLQLVLTALDHKNSIGNNGSPLWEHLIWLQRKGKSSSLDPVPIHNLIIDAEKQRIINENIAPINRLFNLGSHEVFLQRNLLVDSSSQNMGQQDCKDFFIRLVENKSHWFDVFSLFKVASSSFTNVHPAITSHLKLRV